MNQSWTFGKKIAAGFALSFVLMAMIGVMAYRSINTLSNTSQVVAHTHLVLERLADVLNVLPVMRAGALAVQTGLANANARWCHVNFLNFESTAAKNIHVIGDAIQVAQGMPKSGHMANSHAKVTAAAIVAELQGLEINPHPMLTNVCMSYVDATHVIHVASVHEYETPKKSFFTIGGSGGVSDVRSDLEGRYAEAWAKNIWSDILM